MGQIVTDTVVESSTADRITTVDFTTSQGLALQAEVRRLAPKTISFGLVSPEPILQLSEVLSDFTVSTPQAKVFTGKAVVSNLTVAGGETLYEATLTGSLLDVDYFRTNRWNGDLQSRFQSFLKGWEKFYRIQPDFKLAVTDLHSFLDSLRQWLDQLELSLSAFPPNQRQAAAEALLRELPVTQALNGMFERFEEAAKRVPEELVGPHRDFCRLLHDPLLLSPFNHRIYTKPLGYAGDYKMIDMIIRNEYEGVSLFAKLIHAYILDQAPAHSVRNRAKYFCQRFREETIRLSRSRRPARFYSLGCGPAQEVQKFLTEDELSERVEFRLLDFNEETLAYTGKRLEHLKRAHHRRTPIEIVRKSVHTLLKAAGHADVNEGYDLIYCSGLYDYLNDRVCKALNSYLYEQLNPGGVLITTNFDPSNPIRNMMEYVFEWFLIHRDAQQMAALSPQQASPDDCRVVADTTGCNVFLEARKPD